MMSPHKSTTSQRPTATPRRLNMGTTYGGGNLMSANILPLCSTRHPAVEFAGHVGAMCCIVGVWYLLMMLSYPVCTRLYTAVYQCVADLVAPVRLAYEFSGVSQRHTRACASTETLWEEGVCTAAIKLKWEITRLYLSATDYLWSLNYREAIGHCWCGLQCTYYLLPTAWRTTKFYLAPVVRYYMPLFHHIGRIIFHQYRFWYVLTYNAIISILQGVALAGMMLFYKFLGRLD